MLSAVYNAVPFGGTSVLGLQDRQHLPLPHVVLTSGCGTNLHHTHHASAATGCQDHFRCSGLPMVGPRILIRQRVKCQVVKMGQNSVKFCHQLRCQNNTKDLGGHLTALHTHAYGSPPLLSAKLHSFMKHQSGSTSPRFDTIGF